MVIERNQVHVWEVSLAKSLGQGNRFFEILNDAENERAARFYFRKDRDRFVIARASLRLILSRYLNESPDRIEFCYGPNGKPELEAGGIEPRLRFNLSHSNDVALLVVARGRRVGVDVEKIVPQMVDNLGVAGNLFTPVETELVRSAPAENQADVFYRLWTRKEAFLKGTGEGLSASLDHFEVSLEETGIRFSAPLKSEGTSWSVHEFRPCPGYVAAIASEGIPPSFSFFKAGEPKDRSEPTLSLALPLPVS